MATEFAWVTERQVQLGMMISAQMTAMLARTIAGVLAGPRHRESVPLVQLDRRERMHAIWVARARAGNPLSATVTEHIAPRARPGAGPRFGRHALRSWFPCHQLNATTDRW